ncbi:hypothetical protein HK101_003930 [Irineochytrium annulatum]|nr:hypothetical protein HK101_003930 [Irineochytrium annulatum]
MLMGCASEVPCNSLGDWHTYFTSARGVADPSTAGYITSLANRAARVSAETGKGDPEFPTLSLETAQGQEYGTTIAIIT